MIDFIRGTIEDISDSYVVLENFNKGYIIYMPYSELKTLEVNSELKIFTRLVLREDSVTLYGFIDKNARTIFDLLTSVSSVGPKVAMGILSDISIDKIIISIIDGDYKTLISAQGIGKKTAERIILELKDKVSKLGFNVSIDSINKEVQSIEIEDDPAIEALISLGYTKYEASNALKNVDKNIDLSLRIKEALRNIGR